MITMETRLTEHFSLQEMTKSSSHPRIENVPSEAAVENLRRVCQQLELLRLRYNQRYGCGKEWPIVVNSGYRSERLNKAVGGAEGSNHLTGCAADLHCKDLKQALRYACLLLDYNGPKDFDEIIIERKGQRYWLHFAVRPEGNRGKVTCVVK